MMDWADGEGTATALSWLAIYQWKIENNYASGEMCEVQRKFQQKLM